MKIAEIVETDLDFSSLTERDITDMIVIHHTGCNDIDASAEQIHGWHINNGWAGIGYHFVIRKDGTIERGRPEWAVGSHAYGENSHTIGIHLSGDFTQAYPTNEQVENCALLIANLCEDYGIPTDREHIVGHGELMSTDCPGENLQALLDDGTLTGKANYYRYGEAPQQQEVVVEQKERYNSLEDMPDWAKPTIEKMIRKGLLKGNATDENGNPIDLDLSIEMVRTFVTDDRAGVYD